MLRKQIIPSSTPAGVRRPAGIDIPEAATVLVTSEKPGHPVDHAFDGAGGPGGTRWRAADKGEQVLILAFDAPRAIRLVSLEIEELEVARTQELHLALSRDGGETYVEILRQEYNFSPPGTTFEREEWAVQAEGVTHFRLSIRPEKGGGPCRATVTTLALA